MVFISIHAPARGATMGSTSVRLRIFNFNPRSREGSDVMIRVLFFLLWYFNPRSREGSDVEVNRKRRKENISIHAPARGATEVALIQYYLQNDFNPRSREGSDNQASNNVQKGDRFQSTLPRGERRRWQMSWRGSMRFQSTLPRGERQSEMMINRPRIFISIHAPARGATRSLKCL